MRIRLTPALVNNPPLPANGRVTYWEGNGFGLAVTAAGAKSFVVQYRTRTSIKRRLTLGKGLTLSEARREARASTRASRQ